jgi:four helix bundle protein
MKVENFEQLEVWQKAHAMALEVYKVTQALPEEEEFGLILRMRKAACDVPARIANGFERRNMSAKLSLYREARASVEELRYYFILARDLGYTIDFTKFQTEGEALARMVGGLVGSIARLDPGDHRGGRGGRRRMGGGGGGERRDFRGVDGIEPQTRDAGEGDASGSADRGELI